MNSFSFGYGYSLIGGNKKNFNFQIFANFGFNFFKYPRYTGSGLIKGPSGYNVIPYENTNQKLSSKLFPTANVGFCLGFGY